MEKLVWLRMNNLVRNECSYIMMQSFFNLLSFNYGTNKRFVLQLRRFLIRHINIPLLYSKLYMSR